MSSGFINKEYGYVNRRSIRLRGYDYKKSGAYFITICTFDRGNLFGDIDNCKMKLNKYGEIANRCWTEIPNHFPDVELDAFVIMPNHVHGIVFVSGTASVWVKTQSVGANGMHVGAKNFSPPQINDGQPPHGTSKTIGSIIRGFKIGVTKWSRQNTLMKTVWQRNYYERIIRDDHELDIKRQYIIDNPLRWIEDENNPDNIKMRP